MAKMKGLSWRRRGISSADNISDDELKIQAIKIRNFITNAMKGPFFHYVSILQFE